MNVESNPLTAADRLPKRELIHSARKFRVERWAAADAARTLDVIVHPGAVVILPLLNDGRVVLIQNDRLAAGRTLLELPAGTLEPPEPPIDCARRELLEETGFRAAKLTPLLHFYSAPGFCTELLHAFLATGLTPGPAALEPGERIVPEALSYDDAEEFVRAGRIIDAKTIATLLFYGRFVRENGNG